MWSIPIKQAVVASAVVLVLAGSSATPMLAQQFPTPAPPGAEGSGPVRARHQAFIDALAGRLGIPADRLEQAIKQTRDELGIQRPDQRPGRRLGRGLQAAAQAIGISVDQLKQELPGKSLAQVAQAHGKSPADVATALKDLANQRIDQAVAGGRMTSEQATQRKQRLADRIDQVMDRVAPSGGPHLRGPARGGPPAPGLGS